MILYLYHACNMTFGPLGPPGAGPPATLAGLVTGGDTGGMLEHVFDHWGVAYAAPEVARTACSTMHCSTMKT